MSISWKTGVGLNHVGAYQVSGVPFASGAIDCRTPATATEIPFPYVTRWVHIINRGSYDCKVGFSRVGLDNNNHFSVAKADDNANGSTGNSLILELKVSSLYITGSDVVDIVAGVTKIDRASTTTADGANWSGSSGVG